jgi:hypothetical protein
MKNYRQLASIFLVIGLLAVPSVHAEILSLCDRFETCSSNRSVTVGLETPISLTWRGTARLDPRIQARLFSGEGRFVIGDPLSGEIIGSEQRALQRDLGEAQTDLPVAFTINENLNVPARVSERAAASGARTLYYVRFFNLGETRGFAAFQSIPLQQAAPGRSFGVAEEGSEITATGVRIDRISLLFDRGTLTESISEGDSLRAQARIRFQGAGIIDAVWEVATPESTQGEERFVPLRQVRQYLGGSREVILDSPPLPNELTGLHRLRLRFLQPDLGSLVTGPEALLLSYRVSESAVRPSPTVVTISGQAGGTLDPNTRFRWQAVPGSFAYQLEFYDRWPDEPQSDPSLVPTARIGEQQLIELSIAPFTGVLLSSGQNQTRLGAATMRHLQPGQHYYWRVIAIDLQGQVIAASALSRIRRSD